MLPGIALSSKFLFLMSLAYKSRLHIPFILAVLFLAFDIRLQLEVNINVAMREDEEVDFEEFRINPNYSEDEVESIMEEEGMEGDDDDDDDDDEVGTGGLVGGEPWNISDDSTDMESSDELDEDGIEGLRVLLAGLPSEQQLDEFEEQMFGSASSQSDDDHSPENSSGGDSDSDTYVDDDDMETSSMLGSEDAEQAPKEQSMEDPKDDYCVD